MILSKLQATAIISLIRFVAFLFKRMKIETCWELGALLGRVIYHIMPKRRAIVLENLSIVNKHQGDAITINSFLIERIFTRSFSNLTCALKTYTMSPEEVSECVTLTCDKSLEETIASGSGAVFCLAHMGNWEILSKIGHLFPGQNVRMGAVYRPLNNKIVDRYVRDERQRQGCQMFPKSSSVNKLSTFIREGGLLGILADQRAGKKKNERHFFGKLSARSKLPALLQRRTESPLYGCTVSSTTACHWNIHIGAIPVSKGHEDSDSVVDDISAHYERAFTAHLIDVFWLHTYWKRR